MDRFDLQTRQRTEFVEITEQVQALLRQNNLHDGTCLVYCPHTTAAITINENADPDVVHDVLLWLNKTIPQHQPGFRHGEGNSDAHLKAMLIGPGVMLPVEGGRLVLGRWQGIFFCEFDGPRQRTVQVQLTGK